MEATYYSCSTKLSFESNAISRQEECTNCSASLHCCMMCMFYDKSAYNECKEPMAERILDKEKANFCDYFQFGNGIDAGTAKDDLLKAAAALFKN